MTNRLGDMAGALPPPEVEDTTPKILAKILTSRPKVRGFTMLENGDVQFSISLSPYKISAVELRDARHLRTRWCAELIGGFLVRTNYEVFAELVECDDYLNWTAGKWHGGFGLWIGENQLRFQFQVSLLNLIWNESLRHELRGVG